MRIVRKQQSKIKKIKNQTGIIKFLKMSPDQKPDKYFVVAKVKRLILPIGSSSIK